MRNLIIITTTSTYLKAIHLECVGIERRFTFGLEKTFCKRNKKQQQQNNSISAQMKIPKTKKKHKKRKPLLILL